MDAPPRGFATRAVHTGSEPDPETGAVIAPIHLSTTYAMESPGRHAGFEYTRADNPTRRRLEACLASLDGARHAMAFSSGLAATTSLLLTFSSGDHVVFTEDVYGGTFRLFEQVLRRHGFAFTAVDGRDPEAVGAAMTGRTRLVWLETPTNPGLRIIDVAAMSRVAHDHGAMLCIDGTFASPALQRPLELGADIVMHSTTKFLGGHSDVLGGVVLTSDGALAEQLRFMQRAAGAVPSPFDCWLLLRGVKTLQLRVERQSDSALRIARCLAQHPAVRAVHYPGLETHPGHDLASRQMNGRFGGVVSFELADQAAAVRALERLRLITLAESLGAVESLAELPAVMTHASMPPDVRARIGVTDSLIRLAVGIEDVDDLIADLEQALD
jgi:cystathionine beta-lyase/cystathionine gamma-synthase